MAEEGSVAELRASVQDLLDSDPALEVFASDACLKRYVLLSALRSIESLHCCPIHQCEHAFLTGHRPKCYDTNALQVPHTGKNCDHNLHLSTCIAAFKTEPSCLTDVNDDKWRVLCQADDQMKLQRFLCP